MRRLNLKDYTVTVKTPQGSKEIPYLVRDAIVELLFHPQLQLTAVEVLKRDELASKIASNLTDDFLIEEADYQKLKQACKKINGFSRKDVQFVKRILLAQEVEVEVKKNA